MQSLVNTFGHTNYTSFIVLRGYLGVSLVSNFEVLIDECQGHLLRTNISKTSIGFKTWIDICIYIKRIDIMSHHALHVSTMAVAE